MMTTAARSDALAAAAALAAARAARLSFF